MFERQRSGSVVCPSCGRLVGVNDERCLGCGKWKPGLWGFAPLLGKLGRDLGFLEIVLAGCIGLYVASCLIHPSAGEGLFARLSPSRQALFALGASGGAPVFAYGRWWTVLSAAWLHGGIFHIFMNMMCLRQLVPVVGELYGTSRMIIIYVFSSITGFLLTSTVFWTTAVLEAVFGITVPGAIRGAHLTIGASASLLGLCGALIYYGRRSGNQRISQQILTWVIIMFVIGFLFPIIDNWAHFGGLAGGYLIARWLDPLRPEKPEHMIAALVGLVASVAAIAVSFLTT